MEDGISENISRDDIPGERSPLRPGAIAPLAGFGSFTDLEQDEYTVLTAGDRAIVDSALKTMIGRNGLDLLLHSLLDAERHNPSAHRNGLELASEVRDGTEKDLDGDGVIQTYEADAYEAAHSELSGFEAPEPTFRAPKGLGGMDN
jgi:hypothetical protein